MTLILTIGNSSGVYQSSDYQLMDQAGRPAKDHLGSKQLQATFQFVDVRLALTGIASVGAGPTHLRTIDCLAEELRRLPQSAHLEEICRTLSNRCAGIIRPLGSRGVLELILTAAAVGKPFRVAVISNSDWSSRPPLPRPAFRIQIHTIKKYFHLISGYRACVPLAQAHRLRALARDTTKAPPDILQALADINAIASTHGAGWVSEDCWGASLTAAPGGGRRSASLNIGQVPGEIVLLSGGINISEWVRRNFRAAPGKEIGLVQSAGGIFGQGDLTQVPPPFGQPRRFALSVSSVSGTLPRTAHDGRGLVTISPLECVVEARCNEEVTVPFAAVRSTGFGRSTGSYPKPLLPWPELIANLTVNGQAVALGWKCTVGYWVEGNKHHLVLPQSSRSIRSVAFLGADDEIVLVAPATTMEFAWDENQEPPSAIINAQIWWRTRLDRTLG